MKIKNLSAKILIFIISAAFAFILDIYFANWVYRSYEAVVKGILGITLLAMIYRYILPKGLAKNPNQALFTITNLNIIFFSVFWVIVGYWAIRELIDMIFYFIKLGGFASLVH